MAQFGVKVINEDNQRFIIPDGQRYKNPAKYFIEGDASTASYFLGSAAINGKCRVYGYCKERLD